MVLPGKSESIGGWNTYLSIMQMVSVPSLLGRMEELIS
jgi:hypothetical protein